jgi:hypothetical protein
MKKLIIFLMSGITVFSSCRNGHENPVPVYSNKNVLP